MKTDSHHEKHDEHKPLDKREDHQNERTNERKPRLMTPREIRAFHPQPHEADGVNDPGHDGQAPPVHSDPQPRQARVPRYDENRARSEAERRGPQWSDHQPHSDDRERRDGQPPAQRGRPASAVTGEPLAVDLVEMTSKGLQHMPSGYVCRLSIELPEDIRAVHFDAIQGWLDSCVETLARSSEVFRLERPSGSAP